MHAIPPLHIRGQVIPGEKVGRTIGFPTANLDTLPPASLEQGVYFATCQLEAQTLSGLAYFGPRLIFNELQPCFEIYLYNFSQEIYGKPLDVTLTHFMRPPLPFSSLEALQTQLELDKTEGEKIVTQLSSPTI